MAQITSVTSELLQAKIRQVILPVIDLTPTAEGTSTPISMQQAIAFGSNTAFNVVGTTTTIVNNTGFYRITGVINVFPSGSVSSALDINMTDGLSTVSVYKTSSSATSTVVRQNFDFDKIFFVKSGISINVTTSSTCQFSGSVRQIADVNGNLVNPNGFTPQ